MFCLLKVQITQQVEGRFHDHLLASSKSVELKSKTFPSCPGMAAVNKVCVDPNLLCENAQSRENNDTLFALLFLLLIIPDSSAACNQLVP